MTFTRNFSLETYSRFAHQTQALKMRKLFRKNAPNTRILVFFINNTAACNKNGSFDCTFSVINTIKTWSTMETKESLA